MKDTEGQMRVPDAKVPKVRRSALTRVLGALFGFAFLAVLSGAIATLWFYGNFTAQGPLEKTKIYTIGKGLSAAEIGSVLASEGIIDGPQLFAAAAYGRGIFGSRIRAGEYEFPAKASIDEVLSLVSSGRVLTYKLTIPEGWTSEMALARIAGNDVLVGPAPTAPVEAALMPDTYVFQRGMTREKLVIDMAAAQVKLLDELWAKRAPHAVVKTKEEAVILASIVEKETGVATERPQVASVFSNRIAKGMRLQSDPTIIYGLVGGKGKLERSITKADIASETPYNTYVIDGLPPGPIASPGRAALEAVLNPAKTPYLFFVADGTGGHAFATTLEEHNANVKKWRELTAAGAQQPAATPPATPIDPAVAEQKVTGAALPSPPVEAPAGETPAVATPETAAPKVAAETSAPATAAPETAVAETKAPETKAPEAATPVVTPVAKPAVVAPKAAVAVAENPAEPAVEKPLKPGTVLKVSGKLVPIPKLKPKR